MRQFLLGQRACASAATGAPHEPQYLDEASVGLPHLGQNFARGRDPATATVRTSPPPTDFILLVYTRTDERKEHWGVAKRSKAKRREWEA